MARSELVMDVPASELVREGVVTVRVTGMRRARIRVRVAVWLVRLAVFVAGASARVNEEETTCQR